MSALTASLGRVALGYLPVAIVLGAWEGAVRLGLVNAALVPPPSEVARALGVLARDGELLGHAGRSLGRAGWGFAASVVVGTTLGIAMARLRHVERFVQPLVTLTYPLPKSALIPLLMLWLGIGDLSKAAVVFLGSLLPVVVGAYNGVRGVDAFLVWSARNCGTSPPRLVWRVLLPAALPDILAGVRVALALSFVLLVSSELLVARDGLGYLIALFGEGGQYPGMFGVALVVSALGFVADRLWLQGTRWLLRWREP